jgi:hypothetical protein
MRTFLLALGLATVFVGLLLLFAGYVGVGCSVGGTGANPTVSNCGGAAQLELIGAVITAAAVLMLLGSFIPERSTASTTEGPR